MEKEIRNTIKETFSFNLKKLWASRNISRQELADELGVVLSSIAYYENGRSLPSLEMLIKISDVLGVSPNELVGKKQELNPGVDSVKYLKSSRLISIYKGEFDDMSKFFREENILDYMCLPDTIPGSFAVRIESTSMHPIIPAGEIVIIQKQSAAKKNQMILGEKKNGEGFIRTIQQDDQNYYLLSPNSEFPPILVPKDKFEKEYNIIGVVIGKFTMF